jgi:hypothetical protein
VVGGWNNTRSELAGVPQTKTTGGIEIGKWYDATVEVLRDEIKGYLNADCQWAISRKNLPSQDFSAEFLVGIGMGTWNSVCKFRDPLLADKTDRDDNDNTES